MAARNVNRMKLSCAKVRSLTCPAGKRGVVYTDIGGNLTISVSARSKVWRYRFRFNGGNPETISLGKWPHVTYEDAKAKAAEFERARAEGCHPKTLMARPQAIATVSDVLDHHLSKLTPVNRKGVTSLYRNVRKAFGSLPVTHFTRHTAKQWIEQNYEGRKGAARSLIRNLTAAFNRAKDSVSGLVLPANYENPTSKIAAHISWLSDHKPGSYAVAYEDHEWQKIMEAIQHGYANPKIWDAGPMCLELLLYTGARPSEIQSLRWDEIEFTGSERKFAVATKNSHKTWARTGKPRRIVLNEEAILILEKADDLRSRVGYSGPYVFPSRRSQKNQKVGHVSRLADLAERLGKAVGFDFNPYNFRSAHINYAVESLGYDRLPVISANIGHIDVATTERYYRRQRDSDRVSAAHEVGKSLGRLHAKLKGNQPQTHEDAHSLDLVLTLRANPNFPS